jgi:hypothetical protein
MKPETKFLNMPLEFWANVRLISQYVGYTERNSDQIKIPTQTDIRAAYARHHLGPDKRLVSNQPGSLGKTLIEYFEHRATALATHAQPHLMDAIKAESLFNRLKSQLHPSCPLPMNKQSGNKKAPAFMTCIVNMLVEASSRGYQCDYDPRELTTFTDKAIPLRSLSRRVDGAFPGAMNPVAVWEIKEYYYTTTFGSRVADGIYETLLDGYELHEVRKSLNRDVRHYLIVDAYETWWQMGKSYLCRICDLLHMGLLTEVLFGDEVVQSIPSIVREWIHVLDPRSE